MRKVDLDFKNIPRPHYLISAEISEDNQTLNGKVLFPLTDVSVTDRMDHSHIAHFIFAAANAAHVIAIESGCKEHLATEIKIKPLKKAKPGNEIELIVKVEYSDSRKKIGKWTAEFSNEDGLILKFEAKFFASW